MQIEEFPRLPSSFEAELSTFLLPSRAMRPFQEVVPAGGGDDLNVLHAVEHGECFECRSVAPELVGVEHVWHVVICQKSLEKCLCCLCISPSLYKEIENYARFVDCPPQPVFPATDLDAHLIQEPPRTPTSPPDGATAQ